MHDLTCVVSYRSCLLKSYYGYVHHFAVARLERLSSSRAAEEGMYHTPLYVLQGM